MTHTVSRHSKRGQAPWRIEHAIHAPHRLSMRLSAVAPGEPWIEVDASFAEYLVEKRRLLAQHHEEVIVETPESREAQREALQFVVEALLTGYPEVFSESTAPSGSNAARAVRIHPLDDVVSLDADVAPLELTARLVQEDFCLMQPGPEGWHMTAGAVCFPNGWSPRQMLGRAMTSIHERVPGYREKLDDSAHRFFERLKTGHIFRRTNWVLMDDPTLFQPETRFRTARRDDIDMENAGERVWLRVERQTFHRLPHSGAVLFGIRLHQARLDSILSEASTARTLLDAIDTMHPAIQHYKSLATIHDAVVGHLHAHLATPSA